MCHLFFFISAYISTTSDVQKFYTIERRIKFRTVSLKVVRERICVQSIDIRSNRGNTLKDNNKKRTVYIYIYIISCEK